MVYCNLLKSIDLTNREKDFKYEATSSLLGVGQFPTLLVTLHRALNVKYSGHKNFTVYSKTIQCEQKLSTQPILLVVLLPYWRTDSPS
jgi:transposase-like protein